MLPDRPLKLESRVPGETVRNANGDEFYRVRRRVTELGDHELFERAREHIAPDDAIVAELHPDLCQFSGAFPTRCVFLDLETCGFSGSPLFLIGLLRSIDGELVVEQLLARDYTEERGILHQLWQTLADYDVLVTFNGKSFDWPFMLDRSVAHRVARFGGPDHAGRRTQLYSADGPLRVPATHCDLLHMARRFWKRKHDLPNCRLQTLERFLCGSRRHGDIPGYLVGELYHRYVRSRDARHVERVLHHNTVDLLTLARLSLLMVRELGAERVTNSSQPPVLLTRWAYDLE
jgi:uncharacterized protein YprB with RNaseH-like and TPR domain